VQQWFGRLKQGTHAHGGTGGGAGGSPLLLDRDRWSSTGSSPPPSYTPAQSPASVSSVPSSSGIAPSNVTSSPLSDGGAAAASSSAAAPDAMPPATMVRRPSARDIMDRIKGHNATPSLRQPLMRDE
jgi:hypothetical protein